MEPDVQVFNNMNATKFALVDRDRTYDCTWNTEELNQNDYNETGEIKFSIENWLFQTHPVTNIARWLSRQELHKSQKHLFQVLDSNIENGTFTFKQTTRTTPRFPFDISIIVVKKQTENLEILYTSTLLSFVPRFINHRGREAIIEFCKFWSDKTTEIVRPEILRSCPCTLESAKMNPNLYTDFTCSATEPNCHENVNAYRCFLIKLNHRYVCMYMGDTSI